MIDIHHHLLFGLDDGPETMEVSIAMAEMSIANGVTHIVSTPHASDQFRFDPALNQERLAMLTSELGGRITLGLGCDFHLTYDNIEDAIAHTDKYSINGRKYLLVEFSNHMIPPNISDVFFRMGLAGLTPIITHPERNPVIVRNPERLGEWIRSGCYVQITASSLTGNFGKTAERISHQLLRQNWVHFLATDAHNVISRPPRLREAFDLVADRYGHETAERLCTENPRAVFFGEPLPPQPEPIGIDDRPKTGFWRRILPGSH